MNRIIIYGSKYGTTKCYADELAVRTGIKAAPYDEIKDIAVYDTVIYLGALYAGGVLGLKNTVKGLPYDFKKKLIIATVGLADVHDKENINNIRNSIKRQIPKKVYDNAMIFHLRGGIDYRKLNFKHRTMMKMLYKKASNIPIDEQTSEIKAMIETYNRKVDFIDFNMLNNIVEVI